MSDRRDQADDPIESELRSWFKSRGTPAAPSTLRDVRRPGRVGRAANGAGPPARGRLAAATGQSSCRGGDVHRHRRPRGRTAPRRRSTWPAAPTSSPGTSQPAAGSPHPTGSPAVATPIDDGGTFGASGLWAVTGGELYLSSDFGSHLGRAHPRAERRASTPPPATSSRACSCSMPTTSGRRVPGPGSTVPYGGQGPGYDHLYVVVSRTSDGGATWQSVTIPGDWGGSQPVLAFADRPARLPAAVGTPRRRRERGLRHHGRRCDVAARRGRGPPGLDLQRERCDDAVGGQ